MAVTWDEIRVAVNQAAADQGEWAGAPIPIDGLRLRMEPRYPFRVDLLNTPHEEDPGKLVNSWYCHKSGVEVWIVEDPDGSRWKALWPRRGACSLKMLLNAVGSANAWSVGAETEALAKLRGHITEHAYRCYFTAGAFLETSKRSGVTYLFRRLRPTVAMRSEGDSVRVLTCLCLHPIGYYEESWGGVMVPTDDVIAHLLMMRTDERKFWSKANHHQAWTQQSGM